MQYNDDLEMLVKADTLVEVGMKILLLLIIDPKLLCYISFAFLGPRGPPGTS